MIHGVTNMTDAAQATASKTLDQQDAEKWRAHQKREAEKAAAFQQHESETMALYYAGQLTCPKCGDSVKTGADNEPSRAFMQAMTAFQDAVIMVAHKEVGGTHAYLAEISHIGGYVRWLEGIAREAGKLT